jgi:hypothetical protein
MGVDDSQSFDDEDEDEFEEEYDDYGDERG